MFFSVFDGLNFENCKSVWVFHCFLYEVPYSDVVFVVYPLFDSLRSFNLILGSGIYETVP